MITHRRLLLLEFKKIFRSLTKVPMVAHPISVAIPTTPAAGGPVGFPSFVTGAPTAYVIPAGAMPVLQPMISGPAFYSLTSLSSLHHHASNMQPPPMVSTAKWAITILPLSSSSPYYIIMLIIID